jgi:cytolysin (calcineurin-like family phosphatase)
MDIAALQSQVDSLTATVQASTTVEASAATLLNSLGALLQEHANDPAAIQAIADGLTNDAGALTSSAASLTAAVTANTPAA